MEVAISGKITGQFSPTQFHLLLLGSLASLGTWGYLAANVGTSRWGGNRVSTISQPGCSTSVALATGPTEEEEEEEEECSFANLCFVWLQLPLLTLPLMWWCSLQPDCGTVQSQFHRIFVSLKSKCLSLLTQHNTAVLTVWQELVDFRTDKCHLAQLINLSLADKQSTLCNVDCTAKLKYITVSKEVFMNMT